MSIGGMIYPYPNLWAVVAFALVFVAYILLIGCAIIERAFKASLPPENAAMSLFFSGALGILAAMSLCAGLAAMSLFTPAIVAGAALLTGLAAALALRGSNRPIWMVQWPVGVGLLALLISALAFSLAPPGSSWDDTMYHLPVARDIARTGSLTFDPTLRFPLFPQGHETLLAAGLLFGGESAAAFLSTLPVAFTLLGVFAVCRSLARPLTAGLIGGLFVLAVPEVHEFLGHSMVDLAVGLFGFSALILIHLNERRGASDARLLWLAGAMVGGACSVKYVGLPLAAIITLYLIATVRRPIPILQFVGAGLIVGGLWYLRAIWIAGDPFHPFGGPLFGSFLWDRQDLLDQAAEQRNAVQDSPLPNALKLVWRKWGIAALLYFAIALLVARKERGFRALIVISCAYLATWLLLSKEARYLSPVLGTIGIIVGASASSLFPTLLRSLRERFERLAPWVIGFAAAAMMGVSLVIAGNNLRTWVSSQKDMLGLQAYARANDVIGERRGRILQLGFENGKDFAKPQALGDWFGPWRYRQYVQCDTPAANVTPPCDLVDARRMRSLMAASEAKVLIVNLKLFRFDDRGYGALFHVERPHPEQAVLIPR